ncbi:YqjF family protein [Georgenia halophila]|uniref:YqjF family protein n=1 Tax=Georgenia halophila TaxID=620889 RepID=A0ABP8LCE5_9MICO
MVGRLPDRSVARAVTHQRWEQITFLHWRLPAATITPLLPPGLTPHTFDGDAWLSITPLRMHVRAAFTPPVPHLSHFAEVNVRTYVRGPDGGDGIWFFSLECPRLPVVAALRGLGLPYTLARTALRTAPDPARSRQLHPPPRDPDSPARQLDAGTRRPHGGPGMRSRTTIGESMEPDEATDFLTGRWSAYTWRFARLWRVDVDHPPWPLHRAEARADVNELVLANGLPPVTGEPLVHYSPGVPVRIGLPVRARHNGRHG